MTIAELIDYLQQFPPETSVYLTDEDHEQVKEDEKYIILEWLWLMTQEPDDAQLKLELGEEAL